MSVDTSDVIGDELRSIMELKNGMPIIEQREWDPITESSPIPSLTFPIRVIADPTEELVKFLMAKVPEAANNMGIVMDRDAIEYYQQHREAWERSVRHDSGRTMTTTVADEQRRAQEVFERKVYRSFGVLLEEALTKMTKHFSKAMIDYTRDLRIENAQLQDQVNELAAAVWEDDDVQA